ncbi:hypothetical protein BCR42DRAFT_410868 [Absidia repens]|uniref:Uncharacterized protein n=1 Tax=Absidia repens TaxID=90262 RepID=A0A1X2IL03_9FUNG|nr:hypothetical protein BCR42DRAFT_410868 [Absidia repens]
MNAMDSNDSDWDEGPSSSHCSTTPIHPVPFALLKVQIKRLVQQHRERTYQPREPAVIATKDLLTVIDNYEHEHDVMLLTLKQKTAIQPYTLLDPDLEMTPGDILNLLQLVFTCPSSANSLSAPTSPLPALPRTSATLQPHSSRRLSATSLHIATTDVIPATVSEFENGHAHEPTSTPHSEATHNGYSNHLMISKQNDEVPDDDDDHDEFIHYYRRSLVLTQQLKLSEKSLARMTRDNEDQISVLQNRVDDMTDEVGKQKRELLEYKAKETKSLEQIGMLEAHIDTIQKSETDQKQVYLSIKCLYDKKCGETQKLQELLKQKELDLQHAETFLGNFHLEFKHLTEERNRLALLQQDLERELIASHHTHAQLAEQRSENDRLKQVIDTLKYDLDLARNEKLSCGLEDTTNLIETLEAEVNGQLQLKTEEDAISLEKIHQTQVDQRLKSAEDEKDYYKSKATEAMKDLERVKDELSYLKKAMDSENRLLVTELEDLQTRQNMELSVARQSLSTANDDFSSSGDKYYGTVTTKDDAATIISSSASSSSSTTSNSISSTNTNDRFAQFSQSSTDVWSQSRVRGKKLGVEKKREVRDLHNVSSAFRYIHHKHGSLPSAMHYNTTLTTRQKDDKVITGTVTFAIYTLLVYVFGIVTSTFLVENGPPASWEQALMVTAGESGGSYKLLDILLYWIERLLFEGDGVALS